MGISKRSFRLFFALGAVVFAFGCATQQTGVLVTVTVPPEVNLKMVGDNIKKINPAVITGAKECAAPLKDKIDGLFSESDVFEKETSGFEESGSGSVDVSGKVTACSINYDTGAITASLSVVYNGKSVKTVNISEDANRPGATKEEVAKVLVERVAKKFVKMFIPTSNRELREFKPMEPNEPGLVAAYNSNWKVAIEVWTKRVKKDGKDHAAMYNRGIAYEAKGDLKKAVADYKAALALNKDPLYSDAYSRADQALRDFEAKEKMKE